MEESKKLKDDIKEARRKIYDDFLKEQSEDNRKNVDMITRLEMENQKNCDELRLKEDEVEFNYEQAEAREKREQERHEAEMERIRLENEINEKRYKLEKFRTGFEMVGSATSLYGSYKIVTGMIKYDKEKPFGLSRTPFDLAKRLFDTCSKGMGRMKFGK